MPWCTRFRSKILTIGVLVAGLLVTKIFGVIDWRIEPAGIAAIGMTTVVVFASMSLFRLYILRSGSYSFSDLVRSRVAAGEMRRRLVVAEYTVASVLGVLFAVSFLVYL